MNASRTICSRCTSQLRSAQTRRLGDTARFASLGDAASPPRSTTAQSHERDGERGAHGGATRGRGGYRKNFSQRPGFSRKRPSRSREESAVALFNDVVKPGSRATPATVLQHSSPGELEIAARMNELTERDIAATEKLSIFLDQIWPHLKNLRGQGPRPLFLSTSLFLHKVGDELASSGHTGNSIELSRVYGIIEKWDLDVRNQLVLNICHTLVHQKNTPAAHDALLKELVDLWKHISQLCRKSQVGQALKFTLPSAHEILKDIGPGGNSEGQRSPRMHPTTRALTSIFLQFRPDQACDLISGLLTTIAVLSDPAYARPDIQMEAAPLLNLVATALGKENATETYVSSLFDDRVLFPPSKLSEIQSYVVQQWPLATAMLFNRDTTWRRGLASSSRGSSRHLTSFHRQLQAAYLARNTPGVLAIWQDLKTRMEQHPSLAKQMRDDPEFLDYWVFVWCAVRRPAKLQETLDLMQQLQVHPTVKTYTSMMHGWKMCDDADRIEALWEKLASSGMKLDAIIWTARISGLIEGGKPQAGIQALAEMQALWKKAVQKNAQHTAVQPTIEVVNAAFKGLIPLDRRAAFEVLDWAGREQMDPNVRTYNILLRESFRSDSPDDVQSLMKAMKNQGIEPDAATFTIILEEVIGTMSDATATEQIQAIEQVFAEIKAAGLQPNPETYGKMLYAVASLANGADEAIATVLAHVKDNGFKPTSQMITILIERAVNRDPPDMAAVTGLLREHGLTHVSQGDQTLWERVMSAHAITGDTTHAMKVFNDLAEAGRPVTSLSCLTDLLEALLAREQMDEARDVVNVVLEYKTKVRDGSKDGRYWRHHFWHLARENELLNLDEVPQELLIGMRG